MVRQLVGHTVVTWGKNYALQRCAATLGYYCLLLLYGAHLSLPLGGQTLLHGHISMWLPAP